jgi:glucokinase
MTKWAIGVDLGGTKIEIANVDSKGNVANRIRVPTDVKGGSSAIEEQIQQAVKQLCNDSEEEPVGIGVGIAAQIDADQGVIRNAPNLDWHDVPFQENLKTLTKLDVTITNDVRAAAWGEWLYGSGKETTDMICMFVGTGVGGGIVCNNRMVNGCSNTAGEIGHMIIRDHGIECSCGNIGCLESFAGGWAIAKRAQQAVESEREAGALLLELSGGKIDDITAKHVTEAYQKGDPLAKHLTQETLEALIDSCSNLVNAFNPCRFILGGGVIEGLPEMIEQIDKGVKKKALAAASQRLSFLNAALGKEAGVIGAAALVLNQT